MRMLKCIYNAEVSQKCDFLVWATSQMYISDNIVTPNDHLEQQYYQEYINELSLMKTQEKLHLE